MLGSSRSILLLSAVFTAVQGQQGQYQVNQNDIPGNCLGICSPVISNSQNCNNQYHQNGNHDGGENNMDPNYRNCLCGQNNAMQYIQQCAQCTQQYENQQQGGGPGQNDNGMLALQNPDGINSKGAQIIVNLWRILSVQYPLAFMWECTSSAISQCEQTSSEISMSQCDEEDEDPTDTVTDSLAGIENIRDLCQNGGGMYNNPSYSSSYFPGQTPYSSSYGSNYPYQTSYGGYSSQYNQGPYYSSEGPYGPGEYRTSYRTTKTRDAFGNTQTGVIPVVTYDGRGAMATANAIAGAAGILAVLAL